MRKKRNVMTEESLRHSGRNTAHCKETGDMQVYQNNRPNALKQKTRWSHQWALTSMREKRQ